MQVGAGTMVHLLSCALLIAQLKCKFVQYN